MATDAFVHPVTGELLPDSLPELVRAKDDTERELARIYSALRPVRMRWAELTGAAVQPRRSQRTDKQLTVGRCPRCGDDV